MYTRLSGLVLGFHGCDRKVGEKVLNGHDPLLLSKNDYDWLGHGIYFWENSPERAWSFAKEQQERGKIETPFVIGAILDLGCCFNLLDTQYQRTLSFAYAVYAAQVSKGAKNSGGKDLLKRYLDCAVVETVHRLNDQEPFESVRCAFEEGNPSFEGSGFRDKPHIQLCIRNSDCIKGYFLPLTVGGTPMAFR